MSAGAFPAIIPAPPRFRPACRRADRGAGRPGRCPSPGRCRRGRPSAPPREEAMPGIAFMEVSMSVLARPDQPAADIERLSRPR